MHPVRKTTRRKIDGLLMECRKCWKMLPRGNFSNDRTQVGGKSYWCKSCYVPYKKASEARRRAVPGPGYRAADLLRLFRDQQGRCAYCDASLWVVFHADHIVPLSRGGLNTPQNIQLTCPTCNWRKGSKLDYRPAHA
jgi:5-methylcytosine-specific restriction endonuclease McrA